MRNKLFKVMAVFAVAFVTTGALASTSPPPSPTSQDTVVSSTVVPDITTESAPLSNAFMLPLALAKPREAKEKANKPSRAGLRPSSQLSWSEWWSMPQDLTSYNFGWASAEERASHFTSKIKTAGKSHIRRQVRRAAYKANRSHVKKRRAVRAKRGDVKTSKGWINRAAFWTSPNNRALRAEAQEGGLKITKCVQALIDFKADLSATPRCVLHSTVGRKSPAFSALYYYRGQLEGVSSQIKKALKECKAENKTESPEAGSTDTPQPVSVETLPTKTVTEKIGETAKKIVVPAIVAGLSLLLDMSPETVSCASMISMSFKEFFDLHNDGEDTDYGLLREEAIKIVLKETLLEPRDLKDNDKYTKSQKRGYKGSYNTLVSTLPEVSNQDKETLQADKVFVHATLSVVEFLELDTKIEIEEVATFEQQFKEVCANPEGTHQADLFINLVNSIDSPTESQFEVLSEYLYDLEKKYTYGNPRWKSAIAMLEDNNSFSGSKIAQLIHLANDVNKGWRPEEAKSTYIRRGRDEHNKLLEAIKSSMAAEYVLTIKSYPSNDKTLKGQAGDGRGMGHGRVPKIAITADIAWMSGYDQNIRQYNDWCDEMKAGVDSDERLKVEFGDVIFVQNLKDARGNETEIKTLNEAIMALGDGYDAVTPGFWVKRGHQFGDWIRDIFESPKEVRARARSITTTPSQQSLHVDKAKKSTLVLACDLTRNGQPGADGANLVSRNYRLSWDGWLGQLRLHTNYHSVVTKGMQLKGLLRRHKVWAVHAGNDEVLEIRWDRDDKIKAIKDDTDLGEDEKKAAIDKIKAEYLPCILMDVQNIKGRSGKEVASRCSDLKVGEALCLNTFSLEGGDSAEDASFEKKLLWGRFFGGILAEDYAGKSATSWQQNQLFSPSVLSSLVTSGKGLYRKEVEKHFNKLYGKTSHVVDVIFSCLEGDEVVKAKAAAMAQRSMSQRTVESFVFGMKQKWDTYYCDQMDMPSGWFVTQNRSLREGAHKYLAGTGQPQLYHQCILHNKVMDHKDVRQILGHLEKSKVRLSRSQKMFLTAFRKLVNNEDGEVKSRLSFIAGSFGRKGEDTLVWISKIDQDKMQRDSDGDRVLFSHRERDVKLAKLHNEAIKNLPVPKIEVGDVGKDGDDAHKAMVDGVWGDSNASYTERLAVNMFVCAPNQGQGPTGLLVNQASALLNHILWCDEGGNWAPESSVREATLQFYAFVCLLIQNAIDRTKKPHAVPTLGQAFEVNLYDGVIESYETEGGKGNPAIGTESWPAMVWGEPYRMKTRLGFIEQYNTPVLAHFLSWTMNMINNIDQALLIDEERSWIGVIDACAAILGGTTDAQQGNETSEQYEARMEKTWREITKALGREEDDWTEVRDRWVWPRGLYRFKKEASLEQPLRNAAPGLKIVSEMVVEENAKAKKKFHLKGNTMRQVYLSLSQVKVKMKSESDSSFWTQNGWGSDASITTFLSMFYGEIKRGRGAERGLKGQSELFSHQKESDTATYLKEMKDALNVGDFTFPAGKVLDRAFSAKVKNKTVAVHNALYLMTYAAEIGFNDWAANNNVMLLWAKEAYEGSYHDVIWGPDVETDAANEDTAKGQLVRLLAEGYAYSETFKEEVLAFLKGVWAGEKLEHECPWSSLYAADIESRNKNVDGTAYSAIFSQWIPALEEHLELAEDADKTRQYFLDGPGAKDAIQYLLDGASGENNGAQSYQEMLNQCINPGFETEMITVANKIATADLSSHEGEEAYRNHIIDKLEGNDLIWALYGIGRRLNLCSDYREILSMAKPIIQARRLRAWVDKAFTSLSTEEKNKMVRSALLNESTMTRLDPEAPSGVAIVTYRTLKGRPDVAVPLPMQAEFFEGILAKGLSFYALAPSASLWFNFNTEGELKKDNPYGRKLSNKWVYYDARMRAAQGPYNVLSLTDEFAADFAVGDIYSCSEVATWKSILDADLANPDLQDEETQKKIKGMVCVLDKKLAEAKSYYGVFSAKEKFGSTLSTADAIKLKYLCDNICFPLHWGGNSKSALTKSSFYATTTRTSAHRPIWRFIFATLGSEGFTDEKSALYNRLADTKLDYGRKNSQEVFSKEEALNGNIFQRVPSSKGFYQRGAQSSSFGLRPFLPYTTPGVARKVVNGQATWIKVPRSPMNEFFGSVVVEIDGSFVRAYLDDDALAIAHDPDSFLEERCKDNLATGRNSFDTMRAYVLESYRRHEIVRVNGIAAPWRVATEILKDGIVGSPAQKSELVLGCRHITACWDSYVLQKWDATTQARMIGKGPTSWKQFFGIVGGSSANFNLSLPEGAVLLLKQDLFR